LAAFEISAKNQKNRENNKWKQPRPKKINHLSKASGFHFSTPGTIRQMKKPGATPGLATYFRQLVFANRNLVTKSIALCSSAALAP
jgi:hypothetical protein